MMDTNKYRQISDGELFNKFQVPYSATKDAVWERLEKQIDISGTPKKRSIRHYRYAIAAAASIAVLAGLFSIMRFYTTSVECVSGQHLAISLPDGSIAKMNAGSAIKYHPFWFWNSRDVTLSGEAFFNAKSGGQFTVHSTKGKTIVLGTSFNIYSRDDNYRVSCITGRVKVVSNTNHEAILSPGYMATVENSGMVKVNKMKAVEQSISWKDGMFNFTATPFQEVIHEIERQYNVRIFISEPAGLTYTGFFSRENTVEDVLKVVCKPFNLKYTKEKEKVYEISK